MNKKGKCITFIIIYCLTVLTTIIAIPEGAQRSGIFANEFSGESVGALCVSTAYPVLKESVAGFVSTGNEKTIDKGMKANKEKKVNEKPKPIKTFGKDPVVLIVHTHATESYLPSSAGNYHTKQEKNTVREVGETLRKSLEEEGIGVVHDKTLHDTPSYSDSYSRSSVTISNLMAKYPSIICVIDLHRDAIAGSSAGPTMKVKGKTCATYVYVVSDGVSTYAKNKTFAAAMNRIGESDYEGFTGSILERPYGYNQELCSKSVLLELGNNRNNIEEAKNSAVIYGKIMAKALKTSD